MARAYLWDYVVKQPLSYTMVPERQDTEPNLSTALNMYSSNLPDDYAQSTLKTQSKWRKIK